MKGNPALRTVLVLLLLAAVAYPVSRVISRGDHSDSPRSPSPTSRAKVDCMTGTLRIRTAPDPISLVVISAGKTVLEARGQNLLGNDISKELSLASGSDLIVKAEWSDDRLHALRAEFIPDGTNAPVSRDYWSGRTLEDVLSLP